MTSEIAVMNQRAVALAADSAVTLTDGRRVVVRNEQRKLFQLVENRPVGVMFYGVADIMGHPWDHVIEHFREVHGEAAPARLRDYGASFTAMLDNLAEFFAPEHYEDEYRRLLASVYGFVLRLAKMLQQHDARAGDLEILENAIHHIWHDYQFTPDGAPRADLACFPAGFAATIPRDYGAAIDELIGFGFAGAGVSAAVLQQLRDIAVWCVTKDLWLEEPTGLVFAGYGAQDRYPAISTWYVSAIVSGIAKRTEAGSESISNDIRSGIQLFADSAVTNGFILGIDSNLERYLYGSLQGMMQAVVGQVIDAFPEVEPGKRAAVSEAFANAVPRYLEALRSHLGDYQQQAFIDPVLTVLGIATRDDLAQTARELVHLNIFKKRIMAQHETVGGHVDVAVISREGGFQWWSKGA